MNILWIIGGFILVLSPIIIVHELGHFWTARRFGIRIEEFGIGFPPRAAKLFERNGTVYSINWIPLGGFVRPAGEDDPNVPGGLASASRTARLAVLSAGAIANFIFAFFILWVAYIIGQPIYSGNGINALQPTNVVEAAGLQVGDVFLTVNGEAIADNRERLIEIIAASPNQPLTIVVDRAGQELSFSVTPMASPDDPTRGILGIAIGPVATGERERLAPLAAAQESVRTIYEVIALTLSAPVQLVRGSMTPQEARPISVVGISQILGAEARNASSTGDWFGVLFFAGIINVGLGFTNLLPLPALDGGRILFVLIEALRGRRVEPEREGMVHLVGMLLLLGLMALLIVNDVVNPVIPF